MLAGVDVFHIGDSSNSGVDKKTKRRGKLRRDSHNVAQSGRTRMLTIQHLIVWAEREGERESLAASEEHAESTALCIGFIRKSPVLQPETCLR